jgi:hypothetical protein
MKTLFLGHFAATVASRILVKVRTPLEASILDAGGDAAHLAPLLADASSPDLGDCGGRCERGRQSPRVIQHTEP